MAQTLILANSITEANHYARLVGLQRFTYRAVRDAGSIRGVYNAEVHILPSFLKRLDRHAILNALRWATRLEVYYVDPADFEDPADPQPVGYDGQGAPLYAHQIDADVIGDATLDAPGIVEVPSERDLEVAYRYNAMRDAAVEPTLEPKPAPKPRKPRKPAPTPAPPSGGSFF